MLFVKTVGVMGAASLISISAASASEYDAQDDLFAAGLLELEEAPLSASQLGEARGGFSVGGLTFNIGIQITPPNIAPIDPLPNGPFGDNGGPLGPSGSPFATNGGPLSSNSNSGSNSSSAQNNTPPAPAPVAVQTPVPAPAVAAPQPQATAPAPQAQPAPAPAVDPVVTNTVTSVPQIVEAAVTDPVQVADAVPVLAPAPAAETAAPVQTVETTPPVEIAQTSPAEIVQTVSNPAPAPAASTPEPVTVASTPPAPTPAPSEQRTSVAVSPTVLANAASDEKGNDAATPADSSLSMVLTETSNSGITTTFNNSMNNVQLQSVVNMNVQVSNYDFVMSMRRVSNVTSQAVTQGIFLGGLN